MILEEKNIKKKSKFKSATNSLSPIQNINNLRIFI